MIRKFGVHRMSQDKYAEEDAKKNCRNYPYEKYRSYADCDAEFVYNMFKSDLNLMPFWVSKGINEVTKFRSKI